MSKPSPKQPQAKANKNSGAKAPISIPDSQRHAEDSADNHQKPKGKGDTPQPVGFWSNSNHWIAIGTVVIAVATTIYTIYAGQQWSVMDRQLREMKSARRAWLTIRDIKMDRGPQLGEKLIVKVEAFNSGNTPAIDARIAGTVLSRKTLAEALSGLIVGEPKSRAVVGPETSFFTPLETSDAMSNQSQIDSLASGAVTLYVTGTVYYRDIFGANHCTGFCFEMNRANRGFMACALGNSTDESGPGACRPYY